jgi:curved DNA-binding protein CbpA
MPRIEPSFDPYRVLGVLRGATLAEIKAAHRKLAKRYHPDGESGNEIRFLAVQEAYQLLADPARRAAWDRAHAPGPMRGANGPRRHTGAAAPAGDDERIRRSAKVRRRWRAPGQRKRTWSAEHVPWWQDFRPGAGTRDAASPPAGAADETVSAAGAADDDEADAFAVFDRSSGAAWSAAARRHFRRGTDDLPSRGVWRYRGTQVVTGAEARRVAADDEEEKAPR